jgi:hypothetical protein
MNRQSQWIVLAAAVLTASACSSSNGSTTQTQQPVKCMGNALVAHEENNYHFSSQLTLPPISIKARPADLTIDWSGLSKDFLGHAVDVHKDINMVELLVVSLSLDTLQIKLGQEGTLPTAVLTVVPPPALLTDGKATTAPLTTFKINNSYPVTTNEIADYMDPTLYPPDVNTYAAIAANGTMLGKGTRMIQSFKVDPASSNTTITITNDSSKLSYTADLHSLKPTGVAAGQAAITLDWAQMKTNALDQPFVTTDITDALIAHYTQDTAYLEQHFLDLEIIPTSIYRGTIPQGTVVDFSSLKTTAGTAFSGIDASGTWLVALECGGCGIPSPWYLAVLQVCTP